jgi:bifunctional non-homologous end joining protein LigD
MTTVEADGREIPVTNRDKILWPDARFTKGDLIDYYRAIAPTLLPHLSGRPLTMRRFPDGVEEWGWYQYECRNAPEWMRTLDIPYRDGTPRRFCVVDCLASLIWVANSAAIELHTNLADVTALDRPSFVVFDLDPGEPADIVACCAVALLLRERLGAFGLQSLAKTSGSVGLHVYVPLNDRSTYTQTKTFARELARSLATERPELAVDRNLKHLRGGKVLIDWLQNDPTRSMIAPYSLRALPWPTVSAPVTWDEIQAADETGKAELLTFTARDVPQRIAEHGDMFRPVLELEQRLPATY